MDLLEVRGSASRHPWELSRARAVERIVRRYERDGTKSILDYGCGDAFTGRFLLDRFGATNLVGVDPHLTDAQISTFTQGDGRIRLCRNEAEIPAARFDLMLLCDVIEHVPDDVLLLASSAGKYLEDGGRLVVTVPAFQSLFSSHDEAVKHYRRYRLAGLESAIERAGLTVLGSGYLFGSLLPARAVSKLFERKKRKASEESIGLGAWRGGKVTTALIEAVLAFDNSVLLGLAEHGVKAPGLSAWAVCERRGA